MKKKSRNTIKYSATGLVISLMLIFINANTQNEKEASYSGKYYPIAITIDLHLDPMPEHALPKDYVPGNGNSLEEVEAQSYTI